MRLNAGATVGQFFPPAELPPADFFARKTQDPPCGAAPAPAAFAEKCQKKFSRVLSKRGVMVTSYLKTSVLLRALQIGGRDPAQKEKPPGPVGGSQG